MSRRRAAVKREVLPDAKFGDNVLTKFMNCLMYEGKKSVAERIVYGAFDRIAKRSGQDPLRVFHDALGNVRPCRRGPLAPCRRRHLSGAGRSADRPQPGAGHSLADFEFARALGKHDGGAAFGGAARRRQQSRCRGEAAGGYASHGRCEQGLLALPLVSDEADHDRNTIFLEGARLAWRRRSRFHGTHDTSRAVPKHRHHGPYRCR